jgi:hypothetical protein
MGIISSFRTIDDKFSWSFLGFLVGIIGIGYAIYVTHFRDERPLVVFDILSNTQVLSVKENVNKLDIVYNGTNLKERHEDLILLTVRISNEGDKDISEHDYYSKIPFGLKILDGKVADRPILIDASNSFLKNNLTLSYDTLSNVTINNIPLDKTQYLTIKVLIICRENTLPSIIPSGKISGISEDFIIRQSFKEGQKEELSFFRLLTYGNLGIHVARFFFYLFCMMAVGLLIGIPTSKISSVLDIRRKKKIINRFREKTKIELSKNIDIIFDIYKSKGAEIIKWLNRLCSNQARLNRELLYYEKRKLVHSDIREQVIMHHHDSPELSRHHFIRMARNSILLKLLDNQIILKQGDEYIVDEQFKKEIQEFSFYLEFQ